MAKKVIKFLGLIVAVLAIFSVLAAANDSKNDGLTPEQDVAKINEIDKKFPFENLLEDEKKALDAKMLKDSDLT